MVYCVSGAESSSSFMSASSVWPSAKEGRLMIAQYAGVCPSTEVSCSIDASDTCCRAQTATQLSNTPIAARPLSDHNEAPRVDEELATRSRTRPSTVLRTSACDLGVGGSLGFVDFGEEVPKIFRPNQDEVEEELTGLRVELGPGVGVDRDKARTKGRFLSPTTGDARVTSSYDGGSSTGRKSTSFSLLGIIIGDVLYGCRSWSHRNLS